LPAVDPERIGLNLLRGAAALALLAGALCRRSAPASAARPVLMLGWAALLPWPFTDARFLVPLAPFLVAFAAEAIGAASRARGRRAAAALALLGWLAWNLPGTRDLYRHERDHAPFFGRSHAIEGVRAAARFLAEWTGPEERFAATLDPTLHLLSGRPGVSSWVNDDPLVEAYSVPASDWTALYQRPLRPETLEALFRRSGEVLAEYERLGVRHLVRVRSGGYPLREALVGHLTTTHARTAIRFERVWTSHDENVEIWRFER
jgi:hypothetical protein